MGRVTKVAEPLRVEELDARRRQWSAPWRLGRWPVIRRALVNPKPAAELALAVGLARQTVHNLVAAYKRRGPQAVETPGRGQRQRAYLRLGREQAVVSKFLRQSAVGQVSTGTQIEPALEGAGGQRVHRATVYRILRRPQGRQVAPRPRPPQASAQEQAAVNQTAPRQYRRFCAPVPPRLPAR